MVLKSRLSGTEKKGPFKNLERKKMRKMWQRPSTQPPLLTHTHGAILGVFVSPRRDRVIFGVIVICSRLQSERTKHRNRLISWRKRRTERERAGGKERG